MTIVAAAHVHWRVPSDAHHSATMHARCRSRTRTDGTAQRKKGIISYDDMLRGPIQRLRQGYDHNLRRARVAGYVLLAGLFLEVVSCIIWFHGIETLASWHASRWWPEVSRERSSLSIEPVWPTTARATPRAPHQQGSASGPVTARTSVNRTGVHLSIRPGELLSHTSPSPNNSKLLPSFPERARRNPPSRRSRERFALR